MSAELPETPEGTENPVVFTIPVGVDTFNPNEPKLVIDVGKRWLKVPWSGNATFNFTINDPNLTFDNPAITFAGFGPIPSVTWTDSHHCSFAWSNQNSANSTNGTSHYYSIHALYNLNGTVIPVNHDPTVHNDPPG